MKIVAFSGYAGVGKTTAASGLTDWHQVNFATSLKWDLKDILWSFGCDLEDPNHKERARPLLVAYGALARSFRPDYWIARLIRHIELLDQNLKYKGNQFAIGDLRYKNEHEAITKLGGKVIRIERPGVGPANEEEKRSFAEMDEACSSLVVINDGTIEQLNARVLEAVGG